VEYAAVKISHGRKWVVPDSERVIDYPVLL
jgi:hypothetical protein